ncbi:MAG: FAD-dependent oxidoreductase [Anaerolineae bacterium]|nr:FAD-dependent oxidoreductase [Anaerolineae bacterium]
MQLIKEQCAGCGYCVLVCPYDALKTNGWAELIPSRCTDCNLCVSACPADCFVPDAKTPLKPSPVPLKSAYEVVVIGSGLGGLMAGAALARAGRSVAVFEKLGFSGGRYTALDYKGAPVTTGAWTSLGPQSHIGRFLADLGIELEYISLEAAGLTEQYAIRFPDGRHYAGLFELLAPQTRRAWLKAVSQGIRSQSANLPDSPGLERISAAAYLARFSTDPHLLAVVDAVTVTASGLPAKLMPASEYLEITLAGRKAGRQFAMPRGGVRAIVQALSQTLRQAGGELFVRSPVARILLSASQAGRKVEGVQLADGRQISSRVVIHNGGPGRFGQLVGPENLPPDYVAGLAALKGVECAALFCATRRPLFNDAPITITPHCRRVVGIFSPTVLDPHLAKTGRYLFDAFFPLHSADRSAELELALADMRDLFPNFDDVLAWSVPMFFTGAWPGAESGQTFDQVGDHRLDPATPIKNCFLVGMDVKGSGVAGDLIPLGVRRMLAYLGVATVPPRPS